MHHVRAHDRRLLIEAVFLAIGLDAPRPAVRPVLLRQAEVRRSERWFLVGNVGLAFVILEVRMGGRACADLQGMSDCDPQPGGARCQFSQFDFLYWSSLRSRLWDVPVPKRPKKQKAKP